ncbi:MAG TPA: SCO family protein [Bryobacteraceae bacterium]|jgi:protein SCO1/2
MRHLLQFAMVALCGAPVLMGASSTPLPSGQPNGALPTQLEGVGIDEHLGRQIDLNLTFIGESGYPVTLKDYFHKGKPVILNLVYYTCPMLCNLILNGETQMLREIPWTPGNEFEIVTISINPEESFDLARQKKAVYLSTYGRPAPGWHFLTDHDGNAKRLAEMVGDHYRYDERQEQYAHVAAIMILTGEGRVSRYLYGVNYRPLDTRFALAEASENRTTMTVEKILLYCYHYDPQAGSYVLFATNFMRAGGALTVLLLAFFIRKMLRAERNRGASGPPPGSGDVPEIRRGEGLA